MRAPMSRYSRGSRVCWARSGRSENPPRPRAVELEIHLLALLRVLVCLIGAVACALLALAFALTTLVVALWDTHRTLALLGGPWCSSDSRCYSAHWARARCATSRDSAGFAAGTARKTSGAQGAGHDAHGGPAGAAARAVGA